LDADPPDQGVKIARRNTVIGTKSEILRRLNDLYDARRSRFQSAQAELPPILWWNLLAGAALVMIFCCFFGVPNIWMHAAMMAMLAGSMGLVPFASTAAIQSICGL
jgi:hypothetical protein